MAARLEQALNAADVDHRCEIYPDALHDSWTATYANPEVYDWLLQQKRKPTP